MFTGLIEESGQVAHLEQRPAGRRLSFWASEALLADTRVGDSIAVNGCCLTVVELRPGQFAVDVVPETLARTTLGDWQPGDRVHLERSMRLDQRLGGHLVQGHVDGVGVVRRVAPEGEGRRVTIEIPGDLARYVAEKGSLAVDGVSLTVAKCEDVLCEIALIPHTLEVTIASGYRPGSRVNLEVDLFARYIARLLDAAGLPGRST